ncbi:TRAP transporter substrate-binding protein DctP [bacterium]|nr:TRAP transporter substrate-binding protein DctP [bacterium]
MKHVFCLLFVLLLGITSPLYSLTLKIGSPAPEGSPWDNSLREMAVEWKKISKGKIIVKIYPGGIVGDEADMIRKMRIGQLQGGVFTSSGIAKITPEILSLSLPFLVQNDDEIDFLLNKHSPYFEELLINKGFAVVAWSRAGWIHIFSKDPVFYPDDLKKHILAVTDSDATMLQGWRTGGYNAVPLSTNNIMTGLQSGMVTAYYMPPLVSATFQWFALAKNMCSLPLAPLTGALILDERTWKKIDKMNREELVNSTKVLMRNLRQISVDLEKRAISTMIKHGLVVNRVTPDIAEIWKNTASSEYNYLIGKVFSESLLTQLKQDLKEYRKKL